MPGNKLKANDKKRIPRHSIVIIRHHLSSFWRFLVCLQWIERHRRAIFS